MTHPFYPGGNPRFNHVAMSVPADLLDAANRARPRALLPRGLGFDELDDDDRGPAPADLQLRPLGPVHLPDRRGRPDAAARAWTTSASRSAPEPSSTPRGSGPWPSATNDDRVDLVDPAVDDQGMVKIHSIYLGYLLPMMCEFQYWEFAELNRRVAVVGVALSDIGRVDDLTPYHLHAQAVRRAWPTPGSTEGRCRRLRVHGTGTPAADRGGRVPGAAADLGRLDRRRRRRPGRSWLRTRWTPSAPGHADVVVLSYGSTTRADLKKGRRTANLTFGARGPVQFEVPYGHTLIAKYGMAANRHRHEYGTTIEQLAEIAVSHRVQRRLQPGRATTASRSRSTTCWPGR